MIARLSILVVALAGSACGVRPETDLPSGAIEIALSPMAPTDDVAMGWSPMGARIPLTASGAGFDGTFPLGAEDALPIRVRLTRSGNGPHFDRLLIDMNRDGLIDDEAPIETDPDTVRGKIWSSFNAIVDVATLDPWTGKPAINPYPLALWYVVDPLELTDEPVLRYSRRGWMQGTFDVDGAVGHALFSESEMDGVATRADRWSLAEPDSVRTLYSYRNDRAADRHAWLGEQAYQLIDVDPSGRRIVIAPIDPGVTRTREALDDDPYLADREAARSGDPVAFASGYDEARAEARRSGRRLLVDFETDWCGPCHTMDELVWTADAVVAATTDIVVTKVDGDDRRDLVKRFDVSAYPTLILFGADGRVIRRFTGYMGVVAMTGFVADES